MSCSTRRPPPSSECSEYVPVFVTSRIRTIFICERELPNQSGASVTIIPSGHYGCKLSAVWTFQAPERETFCRSLWWGVIKEMQVHFTLPEMIRDWKQDHDSDNSIQTQPSLPWHALFLLHCHYDNRAVLPELWIDSCVTIINPKESKGKGNDRYRGTHSLTTKLNI